jgi:hypothetical protein
MTELRRFTMPSSDETGLIVSTQTYRRSVPGQVPWAVYGLAFFGGVTLASGPPKAGKSTIVSDILRCRETGEPFLGAWPAVRGKTLLVTEESGVAVVHKLNGIYDLDILDRRAALERGMGFEEMLDAVEEWSRWHGDGVVVIDTLSVWASVEDENDASAMTRAVGAVTALAARTGLATVLIHHTRKSGGTAGEAIRGSSAILATVDISAELAYTEAGPQSNRRYLTLQGRIIEPSRHLIEFVPQAAYPHLQTYRLVDHAMAALERDDSRLSVIPSGGATRGELQGLWDVSDMTARRRVSELIRIGRLEAEVIDARGTKRYIPRERDPAQPAPTMVTNAEARAAVVGAPGAPNHPAHNDQRLRGEQGGGQTPQAPIAWPQKPVDGRDYRGQYGELHRAIRSRTAKSFNEDSA